MCLLRTEWTALSFRARAILGFWSRCLLLINMTSAETINFMTPNIFSCKVSDQHTHQTMMLSNIYIIQAHMSCPIVTCLFTRGPLHDQKYVDVAVISYKNNLFCKRICWISSWMWTWLGCTGAWKTSCIFCLVSNFHRNKRRGGGRRRSEEGRRRSSEYVDFDRLTHWFSLSTHYLTESNTVWLCCWLINPSRCLRCWCSRQICMCAFLFFLSVGFILDL